MSRFFDDSFRKLDMQRLLSLRQPIILFLSISFVISAVLIHVQALETLYFFSRQYEEWDFDEIILTLFASLIGFSFASTWIVLRQNQALKKQARREAMLREQLQQNERLRAMGTLLGGIGHTLNNLLMPIQGLTELTRDELPPDSEHATNLNHVLEAVHDARTLLNDLLTFSRERPISMATADAQPLFERLTVLLQAMIPEEVTLSTQIDLHGAIEVDENALRMIVMNLVKNAADALHGQPQKRIEITASRTRVAHHMCENSPCHLPNGDYLRIRVQDTGKGISKEVASRLFEPFFTTKSVGKGTGLGLSTSMTMAMQMGGRILVGSAPTGGAQFDVFIAQHPSATDFKE